MGSWSSLANQPSFNADTMLLLTDGTVMCHEDQSANWHRLKPDSSGSYSSGSWTSLASLPDNSAIPSGFGGPTNAPTYFASVVLRDGRVFTSGGELNSGNAGSDISATQIYDPISDTWTTITSPPDLPQIGDAVSCMLADGRIIIGTSSSGSTAVDILDPDDLSYQPTGAKGDSPSEESWTLLPNGNVLSVQCSNSPNAEQYNPTTNTWISAGSTPSDLTQPCPGNVAEIGPALLLPNGTVFAIGASGNTAIYTPNADPTQAGTWAAGPTLNDGHGNTLFAMDAPAVLLPNGKVLLTASPTPPCSYPGPTTFFEYDPGTNVATIITGPSNNSQPCFVGRMLLLPDGNVLFADGSSTVTMYTPSGSPQSAWQPVIADFPATMVQGHTYTISGTQFNGVSQGCSYGDDAQMATNYPIVQLSDSTGNVVYLRTANHSSMGVATGNTLVTTQVGVPNDVTPGLWNMVVIANGIASDPVSVQVAANDCFFILENSTFSIGEVDTYVRAMPPQSAVFNPAFYVVIEGYTPSEMGINSTADLVNPPHIPHVPSPFSDMQIAFAGPAIAQDPTLPPNNPQRFTFPFTITFTDDTLFGSSASNVTLFATFSAAGKSSNNNATITLTPNPNPYILHGNLSGTPPEPWYLSQDIRTFQVVASPGNSTLGASIPTSGNVATNAINYIQAAVTNLRNNTGSTRADFDNIAQDEDTEVLQLLPNDPATGNPVYNFAIARVRLRDTANATNVRAFFRIWQAQQTNAAFNNILYPRGTNAAGQPIPVLGVQGDEIMTIPFFAQARVTTSQQLHTQRDDFNRHDVIASAGETDYFFGVWLDINQPDDTRYPQRIVNVSADGPFNTVSPLFPIQQFMVAAHQCLIVELAYDPDPIAQNADPSNSDKLAQRNLTFVGAPNPGNPASRRVPQTFEIKPTQPSLPAGVKPDELMIEWNNVPAGSFAEVYLPAVSADAILATASTLYTSHQIEKTDAHTLRFPAAGVTYLPIPPGVGVTFAALLTLDLPYGIHKGEVYTAVIRQFTSVAIGDNQINVAAITNRAENSKARQWRRTTGSFKLTIPVSTKALLLEPEEQYLSVMKWVAEAIPVTSRWYLIMQRYLDQIGGRVTFMGGDPGKILPSGTGEGAGKFPVHHHHPHPDGEDRFIGKIENLVYDRFGDFEAFTLETTSGEIKHFESREPRIADLARRAWQERFRVQIITEHHQRHRPASIILLV